MVQAPADALQIRPGGDDLASWWPSLRRTPEDLWARTQSEVGPGWQVMEDYQRWVLMSPRLLASPGARGDDRVLERTISTCRPTQMPSHPPRSYGNALRAGALGKFSDLLFHRDDPSRDGHLPQQCRVDAKPQRDLGRELLELHTVGRGNYS
jgi:hypothetical protein